MPRILSELRSYHANPEAFIDRSIPPEVRYGRVTYNLRALEAEKHRLGNGHFSVTYSLNSKWVVKIDKSYADPAYEAWADYCMTEGRDNPLCPRIRLKVKLSSGQTMYVIERLQPVGRHHAYANDITDACNPYQRYGEYHYCSVPPCPEFTKLMLDFGPQNFGDLRFDNMMLRDDGQLVLTDPCATFSGRGAGAKEWWDAMMKKLTPRPSAREINREWLGVEEAAPMPARRVAFDALDWGRVERFDLEPRIFLADFMPKPKPNLPSKLHERAALNKAHRGHMHLIHQENNRVRNRQRVR